MLQPRRVRRRRMVGPRRSRPYCRSPRARLLRVGWTAGSRRPRWHRHEPEDAEDSRAVLWMSHRPMISLHSGAEFIAALPSLARGPWISSSRFGDKWSRHASTGSSRALPSLVEDPCRWRLPAPARVGDADVTANDDAVLPCGISSTAEKAVGRSFSRASRRLKSRRSVASANGPGAEAHALDQPERGGIFAHLVAGRP
jgi:hypothetical protein